MSHATISPAILYWGTPVVLITTTNEDGSANIGPISSAWWIGDRCMLGLDITSQTTSNLRRNGQCVLNLASDDMASHVNALARTTGTPTVPKKKIIRGYRHEKDKFGIAGLTPEKSDLVEPPRIEECPVQMEAEMMGEYEMRLPGTGGCLALAIEVRILSTHVLEKLRLTGYANRIDSGAWRPIIMSFGQLYGLQNGKLAESKLAEIDEETYRVPPHVNSRSTGEPCVNDETYKKDRRDDDTGKCIGANYPTTYRAIPKGV